MALKTPKQVEQFRRAYKCMRLRGAYALFCELRSKEGMDICDHILHQLGAEQETLRRIRHRNEMEHMIGNG